MPSQNSTGGAPSQRQLRVGELIRHAIADALQRGEILDPVLETHIVTVPEVRMSPDLKIATVYVAPLGGKDGRAVIKALAGNVKILRRLVAQQVNLKFAPDLRFLIDESFDYASRIETVLRSPKVAQDLTADDESEESVRERDR